MAGATGLPEAITVRLALRCRMALSRVVAIICASVEPTPDEADRIDLALSGTCV